MNRLVLMVFLLATAGELLAVSVHAYASLAYCCKPLLLLSLGLYYY